jgi:hypothetical protein
MTQRAKPAAKSEGEKDTLSELAKEEPKAEPKEEETPEVAETPAPSDALAPTHQLVAPFWDGRKLHPKGTKLAFRRLAPPKSAKKL